MAPHGYEWPPVRYQLQKGGSIEVTGLCYPTGKNASVQPQGVGPETQRQAGNFMNRRDFVVHSAAAATGIGLAAFASLGAAGLAAQGRGSWPYKVIFDARYHASRSFGSRAATLRCPVRPIAGDVTPLWFEELQPLWAKRRLPIVGMTTPASLLCLEQLAWEQWMRVVARVEHRQDTDGALRHRLFLQEDALPAARAALTDDAHWAERMVAPLLSQLGAGQSGRRREAVVLSPGMARNGPASPLVSWIIAARPNNRAPGRSLRSHSTEVAPT